MHISLQSQSKTINETDFFIKYKSSYQSAFFDLFIHSFWISSMFYLFYYFRNSWIAIIPIFLMTLLKIRTFVIFHDCCHNSYTPNILLNYVISHIMGALVMTSPNWILDHHTHHLTNGNIENKQHYFFNETVLLTKKQYFSKTKKEQTFFKIYKSPYVFFTIVPLIYFGLFQRFIYIIKKYRHPSTYSQTLLSITFNHILNNLLSSFYLYKLYEYGLLWHCAIYFSISSSIAFILFHNQHSYNPGYVVGDKEWTQKNSGLLGSSYIQIPKYIKYFLMGIEYHHIHHMNSKIPGYNLQKYHEDVVLKSTMFDNITNLSMIDCYNNLWLAMYDEDKKKYISFTEANEEILKDKTL